MNIYTIAYVAVGMAVCGGVWSLLRPFWPVGAILLFPGLLALAALVVWLWRAGAGAGNPFL